MRQDASGEDPRRGDPIRTAARIAALADHSVGDVGVRADEVIGGDVLEGEGPVGPEAGADADAGRRPADGLEGLLEAEDQAHGTTGPQRHERDERLVLRVLLATERPAGVGGEDPDLGQRHSQEVGEHLLQPVRVLDRAPDRDPITVRCGDVGVGLDGELGHHRELVGVFDHEVGDRRVQVAPADLVLAQDIGRRERVVRPEARVLDERRRWIERRLDGEDGGQLLVLDLHQARRFLGRVLGVGRHGRDGFSVVMRLPDRQHGTVDELGPEARHGDGQVGWGHDEADAWDLGRRGRVDRDDPGACAVDGHEPGLENVLDLQVGHVGLLARHALVPAHPPRGGADAAVHRSAASVVSAGPPPRLPEAFAVARIASAICS